MPGEVSAHDDGDGQGVTDAASPLPAEVKGSCDGDERPIIDADVPRPIEAGGSDDDESRPTSTADTTPTGLVGGASPLVEADGSNDDESQSVASTDTASTGWGGGMGWGGAGAQGSAVTRRWGDANVSLSDYNELRASWAGTRWGGPPIQPAGWVERPEQRWPAPRAPPPPSGTTSTGLVGGEK